MHTYRDGILSTRGAYILFPGDGNGMRMHGKTQNFFIRHPSAFRGPAAHPFPVLARSISVLGVTIHRSRF